MKELDRKIAEVDKILKGNFASQSDKEYWIKKKNELETMRITHENNLKYYKKNSKYNR